MSGLSLTNEELSAVLREIIDLGVVGMTSLVEIKGQRYEVGDLLDLAARMLGAPIGAVIHGDDRSVHMVSGGANRDMGALWFRTEQGF